MAEEEFQEDKTLDPTERRLQKAREEGQFAQSRDLTTLVLLAVFMLFTFSAGPVLVRQMVVMVRDGLTFSNPDRWADTVMAWLSSSVSTTRLTRCGTARSNSRRRSCSPVPRSNGGGGMVPSFGGTASLGGTLPSRFGVSSSRRSDTRADYWRERDPSMTGT